ncbi:MAG TPA: hypothetical protein VFU12_15195 [Glycomyces sp.]|nr:hypothetical protein [Glycomyces sp.]
MTDARRIRRSRPTTLDRGHFTDGVRTFHVRCSSETAPDSFQVYADGNPEAIVLVLSGLNSGALKATWGPGWITASEEWRQWCEAEAFMVFYNGTKAAVGRVRVCNG